MDDKRTYYYRTNEGDYIPMSSFEYFSIFRPCDDLPVARWLFWGFITFTIFFFADAMYLHTGIFG